MTTRALISSTHMKLRRRTPYSYGKTACVMAKLSRHPSTSRSLSSPMNRENLLLLFNSGFGGRCHEHEVLDSID